MQHCNKIQIPFEKVNFVNSNFHDYRNPRGLLIAIYIYIYIYIYMINEKRGFNGCKLTLSPTNYDFLASVPTGIDSMYCAITDMISTNMHLQRYMERWQTRTRRLLSLGGNAANISLLLYHIMYVNVICTSYYTSTVQYCFTYCTCPRALHALKAQAVKAILYSGRVVTSLLPILESEPPPEAGG